MTTLRAYCTCGAKLEAASDPPALAEGVVSMFWAVHQGDGHAPTDAVTARRNRALSRR